MPELYYENPILWWTLVIALSVSVICRIGVIIGYLRRLFGKQNDQNN